MSVGRIQIFSTDVTKEQALEVGERFVKVVDAVAENMGLPSGSVRCAGPQIMCDSCETCRPWGGQAVGWIMTADGRDYCPDCVTTRSERS